MRGLLFVSSLMATISSLLRHPLPFCDLFWKKISSRFYFFPVSSFFPCLFFCAFSVFLYPLFVSWSRVFLSFSHDFNAFSPYYDNGNLQVTLSDADQRTLHELNTSRVPALNARLKNEFDTLELASEAKNRLESVLKGNLQKRREVRQKAIDLFLGVPLPCSASVGWLVGSRAVIYPRL